MRLFKTFSHFLEVFLHESPPLNTFKSLNKARASTMCWVSSLNRCFGHEISGRFGRCSLSNLTKSFMISRRMVGHLHLLYCLLHKFRHRYLVWPFRMVPSAVLEKINTLKLNIDYITFYLDFVVDLISLTKLHSFTNLLKTFTH